MKNTHSKENVSFNFVEIYNYYLTKKGNVLVRSYIYYIFYCIDIRFCFAFKHTNVSTLLTSAFIELISQLGQTVTYRGNQHRYIQISISTWQEFKLNRNTNKFTFYHIAYKMVVFYVWQCNNEELCPLFGGIRAIVTARAFP